MADRGRANNVRDHRGDRVVVRTNVNNRGVWNNRDRGYNRGYNRGNRVVHIERTRPVYRNNGFYFGTTFRPYRRPVINVHYRDQYRRPALLIENMEPMEGYIWIQGNWNWNGYEWQWMPGHYEVDANYSSGYYDGY